MPGLWSEKPSHLRMRRLPYGRVNDQRSSASTWSRLRCTWAIFGLFDHILRDEGTQISGILFGIIRFELGRTGLTAVGDSHQEQRTMYNRAVAVLDQETRDESGSFKR